MSSKTVQRVQQDDITPYREIIGITVVIATLEMIRYKEKLAIEDSMPSTTRPHDVAAIGF